MYKVILYRDKNGESEIEEYLKELQRNESKDAKIKFKKITAYIDKLELQGTRIGEKYVKHIEHDIWELRPLRDRILFAYWENNKFILLSIFMKQTRKTPKREIEKAKRNLKEFLKRRDYNEG